MNNLKYVQGKMVELFEFMLRINAETDYYAFVYYEGDTNDLALSIYKPVEGGDFEASPVLSIHGLGGSDYTTFEKAEEELSLFFEEHKVKEGK